MFECQFSSFVQFSGDFPPISRSWSGLFLSLGGSGPPGPGTPQFGPPGTRDPPVRPRLTDWIFLFFTDQQITSGKLMFACYFSSFVLLSSDLLPPFLARDLGFLGAWADWLFFPPDQQITNGKLMFACYFPSFVLLSSVLLPPFLARDLGFLGAWAARAPPGSICRHRTGN